MQKLRDAAKNYGEGLITAREFLGVVMVIVGEKWEKTADDASSESAKKLAEEFANELASVLETGK